MTILNYVRVVTNYFMGANFVLTKKQKYLSVFIVMLHGDTKRKSKKVAFVIIAIILQLKCTV